MFQSFNVGRLITEQQKAIEAEQKPKDQTTAADSGKPAEESTPVTESPSTGSVTQEKSSEEWTLYIDNTRKKWSQ